MKIYDRIKELLTDYPETRDSDRKLIWTVLDALELLDSHGEEEYITQSAFMEAPSFETIRRCRQKVQELHPELRGSKFVQEKRAEKAEQGGMFVFRENYDL